MTTNISTFFTDKTWIEGSALQQLQRVATLPGMVRVAGFPDLHPGKGGPVGVAMLTEGEFYPYLVGSDVGCGMALYDTDLDAAKAKPEKWAKKLCGLESPWDGDSAAWLAEYGAEPDGFASSLGTIGSGNHFAELLKVTDVFDEHYFRFSGLKQGILFLLVHSGSRGLGEKLLRSHVDVYRDGSLKAGSKEAERYLKAHDNCLKWAQASRQLIATRFLDQLGSYGGCVDSWCHNSITQVKSAGEPLFLHRKGAAPSDEVCVFIPGSRGSCSYLVKPIGDQEANLCSVAHGAGRKWGRNECEGRLRERYSPDSMKKTKLGSYVICEDRDLLYEEAPQAYKDIDSVISDMVGFGLITVVARFAPILTYKARAR